MATKIIGGIALLAGVAFLTIYIGTWVALIASDGLAKAARQSITWPSILGQIVLLVPAFLFGFGGLVLLANTKRPGRIAALPPTLNPALPSAGMDDQAVTEASIPDAGPNAPMRRGHRIAFIFLGVMFAYLFLCMAHRFRQIGALLALPAAAVFATCAFLLLGFGIFGTGRWRFGLRSFLIATTLIAVVLGVVAWATR